MTDPEKTQTIRDYPPPTTIKELRSFLGTLNYCRDFVVDMASFTAPLYDILKGHQKNSTTKIEFTEKQEKAFFKVKEELLNSTTRAQPDFSKEFTLITDASVSGIGAALTQKDDQVGML